MENGEIGIIVTKDLSRLGRNQLHTGLYIEERFTMFGVCYIAINDNVDTDSSESNDLMPFKNLFNEWFIWKHRKPRTQRNPGRHRKHDDLPGYPRNHLLPLQGGEQRLPCPFCPHPGRVYRQQSVKFFQRMPHSCEYHCAASGTATPPRRYSAASAHFARYDRASSNQTSCSVPPRQKL